MHQALNFILLLVYFIYLPKLTDARVCAPPDPLARPACPGSWRYMTESDCDALSAECCWNDTVDPNYPFCYYVPKDVDYVYNIALHKPTFQKSTAFEGVSSRVVDGCSNTDWAGGCCSHTQDDLVTWWSVDLTEIYTVVSVTITTRNAYAYVEKFKLLGSNTSHDPNVATDMVECADYPGRLEHSTVNRILCSALITIRYLMIQKKVSSANHLSLCEVQVEAAGRFNAALGKLARQTTNLDYINQGKTYDTHALKSVDGCTLTTWNERCTSNTGDTGPNPWWSVDLGRKYMVYSVTVKNRDSHNDNLKDLTILTSNNSYNISHGNRSVCGIQSPFIPYNSFQNIPCTHPVMARYVIITKPTPVFAMVQFLVEAECAAGKYGISCQSDCHNCRDGQICDVVSGHCPRGLCASGYQGPRCDRFCAPADSLVRPACPGSWKDMTEADCFGLSTKCCWDDTVDTNYPFCYYVPKDVDYAYNIALHKPTFQKTTLHGALSSRAVDGCSNVDWAGDCCSHTDADVESWWSVDLAGIYTVVSVTITSRNSQYKVPVEKFKILGSNTIHDPNAATDKVECADHPGRLPYGIATRIPCGTLITVRYLTIQKRVSPKDSLVLCEVEVEVAGRFNAALGKMARQKGNLDWNYNGKRYDTRALKSVDGCALSIWQDRCTNHPGDTGPNPWWSVDLGKKYMVYSVTIKSREEYDKLQDLTIFTSNNTNNILHGDRTVCGTHGPLIPYYAYQNIPCTNRIMARYVIITQPGFALSMTEVLVEAECAAGKYGISCQSDCQNCRHGAICDAVGGHCPGGLCVSGYQGPKCDQSCNGAYGENCLQSCSSHCSVSKPNICDPVSGECPQGLCHYGYLGPQCILRFTEPCPNNTYGSNCTKLCSGNCLDDAICDKLTGSCPDDACKPGYTGFGCFQKCPVGTYGLSCLYLCSRNCKDNLMCDFIDGSCPGGCIGGYQGDTCDQLTQPTTSGDSNILVIVIPVAIAGIIILAILATVCFVMKLRLKTSQNSRNNDDRIEQTANKNRAESTTSKDAEYYNIAQQIKETDIDKNMYEVPDEFKEQSSTYEQLNI